MYFLFFFFPVAIFHVLLLIRREPFRIATRYTEIKIQSIFLVFFSFFFFLLEKRHSGPAMLFLYIYIYISLRKGRTTKKNVSWTQLNLLFQYSCICFLLFQNCARFFSSLSSRTWNERRYFGIPSGFRSRRIVQNEQ